MKKLLILLAATSLTIAARAQDYKTPLAQYFTTFDTTSFNNVDGKMAAVNKLTLIAKKYPDVAIASYYAALAKAQITYMMKDEVKRDALLDDAEAHLADAVRLWGKETDETHVLRAQIANARMVIDGQKRYMKYGKIFDEELDAAKDMNPDNPRIYLLRGQSKFWTPKMFGGGKKSSLPYFEKAATLYSAAPANDWTQPAWGSGATQYYLGQIKAAKEEE